MGMAFKRSAIVQVMIVAVILATSICSCVGSQSHGRSGHMIARTTERSLLQESEVLASDELRVNVGYCCLRTFRILSHKLPDSGKWRISFFFFTTY